MSGESAVETAAAETPSRSAVKVGATVFGPEADLIELIRASLAFDSATDVVVIDLAGKSSIADYMVVASANSGRLVASVSEKLIERLRCFRGVKPRSEGVEHGDWALIDAEDVIIHVFRPEVRDYYALEKMWAPELAAARKQSA